MNTRKFALNINSADVIAYILSIFTIYTYFSTNDESGALYLVSTALFFFGISFVIDAITKNKTIIITTPGTVLNISASTPINVNRDEK
jgi:hypothetical protein